MLHPISTLAKLYKKFRLPLNLEVADALFEHNQGLSKKEDYQHSAYYYSTYRSADFDSDKWKKELPLRKIRMVEQECSPLFDVLGYSIYEEPQHQYPHLPKKSDLGLGQAENFPARAGPGQKVSTKNRPGPGQAKTIFPKNLPGPKQAEKIMARPKKSQSFTVNTGQNVAKK